MNPVRQERLLWEGQLREIDLIVRHLADMRSSVARRVRRLSQAQAPRPVVRRPSSLMQENLDLLFAAEEEIMIVPREPRERVARVAPRRFRKPKVKLLALKKKDAESVCDSECSICYEKHAKVECSTLTECKHEFGRTCLETWMSRQLEDYQEVTCPLCRVPSKEVVSYRPRKAPVRPSVQPVVPVAP